MSLSRKTSYLLERGSSRQLSISTTSKSYSKFDAVALWIAFDPYAFVIVRTPAPSIYEATRYGMTGHFEISVAFGDSAGEEVGPVFQNSPAGNIRQEDIDEWNTPPSTLSDAEIDAICK